MGVDSGGDQVADDLAENTSKVAIIGRTNALDHAAKERQLSENGALDDFSHDDADVIVENDVDDDGKVRQAREVFRMRANDDVDAQLTGFQRHRRRRGG